MNENDEPEIVKVLRESEYQFYLTGSRYFQSSSELEGHDWDFFCQNSKGVINFLKGIGFQRKRKPAYIKDSQTVEVYTHQAVDVQVVNSVRIKQASQLLLKELGVIGGSKELNQMFWNVMYTSILEVMNKVEAISSL